MLSWESKETPPMPPPPRNRALIRPLGGDGIGGVPLDSHEFSSFDNETMFFV